MNRNSYQLDMCNGPLAGKMIAFALPLMASGLLQLMFNAADIVVVGRYAGSPSLAAVGSTTSLINLIIALFMGLSIGSNVTVAQDLGAGRLFQVERGVHTAILLSFCSGVLLTVLCVPAARFLLAAMSTPHDVIDLATVYLRIYFLGMPGSMAYNFGSAILRANGDTRRPLYFLLFSGVVNLVLNLFFVIVMRLGVAGVAIATVASQYISAGLVLRCLCRENGSIHLNLHQLAFDRKIALRIIKVGLPAGFQSIVFSLSNVVVQSTVNSFGSTVMSGCAAAQNIEGFAYTAMNTFHQTGITFTGQNYGAGKCKRVDRVALYCIGFVCLTGLCTSLILYFGGESLLGFYAPDDPEAVQMGLVRLRIVAFTHFTCGMMDVLVGILRGLGNSFLPMIVSMVGACGVRLLWVWFVFPLNPTLETLFLSYPISWIVTAIAHAITLFFVRKKAYAVFDPCSSAYERVEGHHPSVEQDVT